MLTKPYYCSIVIIFLLLLPHSVDAFGPFSKASQNPVLDITQSQWDSVKVYMPSAELNQNNLS
mgnify:CR=1